MKGVQKRAMRRKRRDESEDSLHSLPKLRDRSNSHAKTSASIQLSTKDARSSPVRVISRVEGPSVGLEFVREDEVVLEAVESGSGLDVVGSILVDQRGESRDDGNLMR